MKNNDKKIGISILFGLTFLSPISYSIIFYEMDVIQRIIFFVISILLLLVYISKIKTTTDVQINKFLFILIAIFPFTFLTCFINNSSSLLLLKLSDLTIPISIFLQSALLFIILGEEKFFKVVSYSVVIASTIFSVIGVLEVFQIKIIDLPTVIAPGSTLGNRSFAAEYLLTSLPFFLLMNEFVSQKNKVYLAVAAIINISFLLFTRNRSGLLILIFIIILYIIFILIRKEKGIKIKSIGSLIVILMISFFISMIPVKDSERPDLQSTASTLFDSEFKSNVLRLSFWNASIEMIKENPFAGVGLYKWSGNYPRYNGEYFNDQTVTKVHSIHAHNDFLELITENGVISALVFLLIFLWIVFLLFRRINYNEKYFYLLLSFIITFAFSFVAFPNHKFASFFLAAVITGPALINNQSSGKKSFQIKFSHLRWVLLFFMVIGCITSSIRLKSEFAYREAIYLKDRAQYFLMSERLERVSEILYPFDASKQPIDYYRGIANSYLKRFPEALKNNLSGQELAPFNPIILQNIGGSYYSMQDFNKAIQQYEKVKKYFPNYILPQVHLLTLYDETGQTEKEKSLYFELVKKSPNNPRLIPYRKKFEKK